LRDLSDRRDLPVIVIGCDFPTELRRDLKLLDQVYLLSLPVDFDTLCQIIHKTAGSRS